MPCVGTQKAMSRQSAIACRRGHDAHEIAGKCLTIESQICHRGPVFAEIDPLCVETHHLRRTCGLNEKPVFRQQGLRTHHSLAGTLAALDDFIYKPALGVIFEEFTEIGEMDAPVVAALELIGILEDDLLPPDVIFR